MVARYAGEGSQSLRFIILDAGGLPLTRLNKDPAVIGSISGLLYGKSEPRHRPSTVDQEDPESLFGWHTSTRRAF